VSVRLDRDCHRHPQSSQKLADKITFPEIPEDPRRQTALRRVC